MCVPPELLLPGQGTHPICFAALERIGNGKRPCRLEGFCDDAKSPVREVPLKSAFQKVHPKVAADHIYGLAAGSEVLAKLCVIFPFLATLCLIFWATIAHAVQKTKTLQWPNYASCGQIMVEIAFFEK